jgi:hypothetical protein
VQPHEHQDLLHLFAGEYGHFLGITTTHRRSKL